MKILGWMHRKFRQNTTSDTHNKDFSIGFTGQPSSEDLQYYPKGSYGSNYSKPFSRAQRDNYLRNSFNTLEAATAVEEEDLDEEPLTELFHGGFLAIGTLGGYADPATPTFSISVDHIAEKATAQVTETELRLINDELEKVLGDDVSSGRNSHVSAGRNSHVSAGRNSHCSTITLSGKLSCGNEAVVCPLQSYLFGAAVETAAPPPARKEQRTSLGELFQKTKQVEDNSGGKKSEKRSEKETEKSGVQAVKRMLKRRMMHAAASKGTAPNSGVMDSTTAETKLHKILHMFNRKVHPENAIICGDKIDTKKKKQPPPPLLHMESLRPSSEDIIIYPQAAATAAMSKQTHLPQLTETTAGAGAGAGGNELWDKTTDADYLVLEL